MKYLKLVKVICNRFEKMGFRRIDSINVLVKTLEMLQHLSVFFFLKLLATCILQVM